MKFQIRESEKMIIILLLLLLYTVFIFQSLIITFYKQYFSISIDTNYYYFIINIVFPIFVF